MLKKSTILKKVKGAYTLEVERAQGNFEDKIRDLLTSFADRMKWGGHFLSGLTQLHKAGYAYGDMKPENCLLYGSGTDTVLKIADFGKAQEMLIKNQQAEYKGNTRYAAPEGVLSKKADVFSAGMVLIRNLEEECLKGEKATALINIPSDDPQFDMTAHSQLRGIEKYVVEHKAFLACNPGFSLKSLMRRSKMGKLSTNEKQAQLEAMHQYIDILQGQLIKHHLLSSQQAADLCLLIKDMTKTDHTDRISMAEALQRYGDLLKPIY